jgi:hypothetical protein
MTELHITQRGEVVVQAAAYRLVVTADGMLATLSSPQGEHWAALRPLAALDATSAPDETLAVAAPRVVGDSIEIDRRSTLWDRARTTFVCTDDAIEFVASVEGRAELATAHLLAARSTIAGAPTGFMPSGSGFSTLFSPNPADPAQLVRSAAEEAVIGVSGDGQPGRGHWFFTPAPLSFWLTTAAGLADPQAVDQGWVGISLAAPVSELTFVQLVYAGGDRAFSLRLDYEGHTRVDGKFRVPTVLITPGAADPYTGLRRHRDDLVARGAAPPPEPRGLPDWWAEPIFCGWGAQSSIAARNGLPAPALATQARYDRFLEQLEEQGVVPGTVVIDDKWQEEYGTNEPDAEKWPDLRGWIAARHARGQHVLLWWKAWDPEGVSPELCIRNVDGTPIALDPTNPRARAFVRAAIRRMLDPGGLDADGLKIDFTARTPSGASLSTYGDGWGIALLHDLLAIVYAAAKEAKPDALVITHTPHPAFVDVADVIRLNDMLRLDDHGPPPAVVPQMRFRAAVVRAACPELLIDTDDWSAPNLDQWRRYLAEKPLLGIPSLYYADSLDSTGEELGADDYRALRTTWAEWRERRASEQRSVG